MVQLCYCVILYLIAFLIKHVQNTEVVNQSLLYFSIEMRNRFGGMRFDVDNMSYEVYILTPKDLFSEHYFDQ